MSIQNKRRVSLITLAIVVIIIASMMLIHWLTIGRYQIDTDDAYISGNMVQLMAQTSGNVQTVDANDTQWVRVGAPLVELNGADAHLALEKAKTELAQTVRSVNQQFQNAAATDALVLAREATLKLAQSDFNRRNAVSDSRAISKEDIEHAKIAVSTALANLSLAQHQQAAAHAAISNTTLATHPEVLHAEVDLRQAWLGVQRLIIRAPVSGIVAKRNIQVGQRVNPDMPLMVLIPDKQIWLDANFKENQLAAVRIGQPVTFTTDLYGSDVTFHGNVAGLSAGTGSVFSLLPAQNATGNWIKVVQRLPLRISLNAQELLQHPLQLGLSATVTVDVHDQTGLGIQNHTIVTDQTPVLQQDNSGAEQMISRIIHNNSGA